MVCLLGTVLTALRVLSYLLCAVTLCRNKISVAIGIPGTLQLKSSLASLVLFIFFLSYWSLMFGHRVAVVTAKWPWFLTTRAVTLSNIFKGCGLQCCLQNKDRGERNAWPSGQRVKGIMGTKEHSFPHGQLETGFSFHSGDYRTQVLYFHLQIALRVYPCPL